MGWGPKLDDYGLQLSVCSLYISGVAISCKLQYTAMTVVSGEKQTHKKPLPAESGGEAAATEGNGGERAHITITQAIQILPIRLIPFRLRSMWGYKTRKRTRYISC